MKNLFYLSKLNLKGKGGKIIVVILITLLVISFTLIPCYNNLLTKSVNSYKEDYTIRSISLLPFSKTIDKKAIKNISKINHVEKVVDSSTFSCFNFYLFKDINGVEQKKILSKKTTNIMVQTLEDGERKSVLAGETLENSPVYSCLVPKNFYPYADRDKSENKNLSYLDGTKFLGKTITLKADKEGIDYEYYKKDFSDGVETAKNFEIKLKIVGVYNNISHSVGGINDLLISKDTDNKLLDDFLKAKKIDKDSKTNGLAIYLRDKTLHPYYIVVDSYENKEEVYNKVNTLGYYADVSVGMDVDPGVSLLSSLMSTVGVTLTYIILAFAIFILFQATINSISDRKGTIGLMKAIGYKNKQIFVSLALEQLKLTIIGFIVGGVVSVLTVFILNTIFSHGTYIDLMYVLNWGAFGIYLLIALGIVIIIPILCQLVLLGKLAKIQPQEAMINE